MNAHMNARAKELEHEMQLLVHYFEWFELFVPTVGNLMIAGVNQLPHSGYEPLPHFKHPMLELLQHGGVPSLGVNMALPSVPHSYPSLGVNTNLGVGQGGHGSSSSVWDRPSLGVNTNLQELLQDHQKKLDAWHGGVPSLGVNMALPSVPHSYPSLGVNTNLGMGHGSSSSHSGSSSSGHSGSGSHAGHRSSSSGPSRK
jgi:hypothetical protein